MTVSVDGQDKIRGAGQDFRRILSKYFPTDLQGNPVERIGT